MNAEEENNEIRNRLSGLCLMLGIEVGMEDGSDPENVHDHIACIDSIEAKWAKLQAKYLGGPPKCKVGHKYPTPVIFSGWDCPRCVGLKLVEIKRLEELETSMKITIYGLRKTIEHLKGRR